MNLVLLFTYSLLTSVQAKIENDFFIEYYNYKKASSVTGFTCNVIEDDLLLIKNFNIKGVSAIVNKLNNGSKISKTAHTNYWKIGVFLDTRCYDVEEISSIFSEASDNRMFGELHYWIILGSDLENLLNLIDDRAFGLATDLIAVVPLNGTQNQYELYDIYNMSKERGNAMKVTFFGSWTYQQGLNLTLLQTKFERRSNLQGFTLKAAYFKLMYRPDNMSLEEYFNDYEHSVGDAITKFGFKLISHLADLFNFSLESYETAPWLPGDAQGPLAWSMINNTADFTGNPLSMTSQRTYMFKYVHQDWPFRTCFIFRNPQPTNIKIQEILRPFTNIIWYFTAMIVMISIIILIIVLRFEGLDATIFRISNSVLLTVGALCQQSTEIKMNHISSRIAFFFVMMFGLLMYNYYSACVVSARLDEPIYKINDSLNIFGKLQIKMASESMVYLEFFLKKPDWDTTQFYHNHWLKLSENEKIINPEKGMKLVKKGGFAYHTHPDVGYPFIDKLFDNREICELMEVHLARPIRTAFGATYNSSFVEIGRVGFSKINEVGLRHREYLRWSYKKPACRKDILSASSINKYQIVTGKTFEKSESSLSSFKSSFLQGSHLH